MRKRSIAGVYLAGAVLIGGLVTGVASASSTAVPAGTASFDGGNCTAKFVRSASGIVNETNRECTGAQNPWTSADVQLQFRPLDSTPNPAWDPTGLVTSFGPWSNSENSIEPWFQSDSYNVCVYLVNPVVAFGSIDATTASGSTATLPTNLPGRYRIDITGTWIWRDTSPLNVGDANYLSTDGWATYMDGYPGLGAGAGDVQVSDNFVAWGAYSANHRYSTTTTTGAPSINLRVFEGNSTTDTLIPSYYSDNQNIDLAYTITYLGQ